MMIVRAARTVVLALGFLAAPIAVDAQPAAMIARIGLLELDVAAEDRRS